MLDKEVANQKIFLMDLEKKTPDYLNILPEFNIQYEKLLISVSLQWFLIFY